MTRENYAAVLADVQQQIGGAALKAATEEARAKVKMCIRDRYIRN